MITSYEKINLSGNKLAEVYLHKTPDKQFIVSIPAIHWSAEFNLKDDISKLQSSLNFHMFQGDTDELVTAIEKLVQNHF
ncbi:MAG: YueH family protein [Bacillota bacterium]